MLNSEFQLRRNASVHLAGVITAKKSRRGRKEEKSEYELSMDLMVHDRHDDHFRIGYIASPVTEQLLSALSAAVLCVLSGQKLYLAAGRKLTVILRQAFGDAAGSVNVPHRPRIPWRNFSRSNSRMEKARYFKLIAALKTQEIRCYLRALV